MTSAAFGLLFLTALAWIAWAEVRIDKLNARMDAMGRVIDDLNSAANDPLQVSASLQEMVQAIVPHKDQTKFLESLNLSTEELARQKAAWASFERD